jgi:polyisoprenoid-binding protein YceI
MEISMRKTVHTAFATTLLAFAINAQADLSDVPSGEYAIDDHHAYISFTYSHIGFSTPHVGFRKFDANLTLDSENPENSQLEVLIDTTSVDSRVDEFNGHLRGSNFFDTDNHPQATFSSTSIESTGENTFNVTGDLTIKGMTNSVTLEATLNKAAMHPMRNVPTVGFSAETTVSRSDFGMARGVPNIGDEVTIYITVEMPQKEGG